MSENYIYTFFKSYFKAHSIVQTIGLQQWLVIWAPALQKEFAECDIQKSFPKACGHHVITKLKSMYVPL